MRVIVDFDVCASTGTCTNACPEVFEIRADGYLYLLGTAEEALNPTLLPKVLQAAEQCPTGAIRIEE
ncbi:MAG: ferredoxin [Rubrivivax sp.]|nr:ferredoxin [Rubrivivax sp.]